MLLLQALPTSIGVAAIAPALLVLWLVIAADERPGPPTRVWLAFILGAASISLLGIARAPFAAILAVPGNPWMTQALRSVFGVAAEVVRDGTGGCFIRYRHPDLAAPRPGWIAAAS
jgi:cell shape-determining protein MreD